MNYFSSNRKIINLLIKKDPSLFCDLVAFGNRYVKNVIKIQIIDWLLIVSEHVMQVLNAWHNAGDEDPQWQSLLCHNFACDENNTPFREMIRKMPGMFNECSYVYMHYTSH